MDVILQLDICFSPPAFSFFRHFLLFIFTSVAFLHWAFLLPETTFTLAGVMPSVTIVMLELKWSTRSLTGSQERAGVEKKAWMNNLQVFSVIYRFLINSDWTFVCTETWRLCALHKCANLHDLHLRTLYLQCLASAGEVKNCQLSIYLWNHLPNTQYKVYCI